MSKILIKGQKVTKSEQWLQCDKFWTKKGHKLTKSEQWPKCQKFRLKVKKLQNQNNDCNVIDSDHRSKSYKFWTMPKMS